MARYCRVAVERAIQASNRSGRHIGRREADAIHRLLAGREAPSQRQAPKPEPKTENPKS